MQTVTIHEEMPVGQKTMMLKVVEDIFPYFCKASGYVYCACDNKKTIQVSIGGFTSVVLCDTLLFYNDLTTGQPITETEFTEAYQEAMEAVSHSLVKAFPCNS